LGRARIVNDEEILRRARGVFREGGHAASTREVARAAGVSQAVLYQRFGSKADLFFRAMSPDPPDLESLFGPYPARNARSDLEQIGIRLGNYLRSLMPTLLHVLAPPHLDRARLARWHEGLPFLPIVSALAERLARFRNDGLIGRVDPIASARAFLAAVHSAALLESMTHRGGGGKGHTSVEALIDVLWTGLAPSACGRQSPP